MLTREGALKKNYIEEYNGFNFEELSHIPKINLRGDSNDKNFVAKVRKILDTILPEKPNTSNSNNKLKIIWLSPNEWFIEIYKKEDFVCQVNWKSVHVAISPEPETKTTVQYN